MSRVLPAEKRRNRYRARPLLSEKGYGEMFASSGGAAVAILDFDGWIRGPAGI
jgi:hypothetical protein